MISIEKGQLLCSNYECPVKIRFDESAARTYTGNEAADNSSEVIFIPGFDRLSASIAKAKLMRIQVNVYQEGAPTFEFDVSGFDPSRLN